MPTQEVVLSEQEKKIAEEVTEFSKLPTWQ